MTIQSALHFIHHVMNDDNGRSSIRELSADTGLDQVVELGRVHGFEFSINELRRAFTFDWQMRAKYYSSLSD